METEYELGQKMIDSIAKEKIQSGFVLPSLTHSPYSILTSPTLPGTSFLLTKPPGESQNLEDLTLAPAITMLLALMYVSPPFPLLPFPFPPFYF